VNRALVAAAATGVQVGATIVASRYVVAEVPPLTLACCGTPSASCLAPSRSGPGGHVPALACRSADLGMAALGIGQFAVLIALLNFGLQHVGAGRAALIFSLFPLLTLLLSAALGHERITPALATGVLLSIAGVALSLAPKLGAPHPGHWWGEGAVLASAGVGALCSVLYRPYLQRYPTLPVSALAMGASVLFLAPMALVEGWPARVAGLSAQAWAVVAFIGVSSGAGYFAWLYALKHESPTRETVFLALNPVTAAVLGALLLSEPIDGWMFAAIACIGAGLWRRRAAPVPQPIIL
jgi:drug/metabolite transporter (DMT)-like permease